MLLIDPKTLVLVGQTLEIDYVETSSEVVALRKENSQLKHLVADLSLRNAMHKKREAGLGQESDEE